MRVSERFATFAKANEAITKFCKVNCHPVRSDKKETVQQYNARVGNDHKINNLQPDDVFHTGFLLIITYTLTKPTEIHETYNHPSLKVPSCVQVM